jgi:hypothetical protein
MGDARRDEDAQIEDASREVARAIWQTVLLGRDEAKARGLIGQVTCKKLVDRIIQLMRGVRGR